MKQWDPANVVVSFLGAILSGFADGTFIQAARNEDTWTLTKGADGEGARTRNRNGSGRITLTLLQTSLSNDVLSAAVEFDELTGEGVGPFIVKDTGGTFLGVAANAWIVKPADGELAKTLSNREWVFECDHLDIIGGGTV